MDIETQDVVRAFEECGSCRAAAKRLGISHSLVSTILRAEGICRRKGTISSHGYAVKQKGKGPKVYEHVKVWLEAGNDIPEGHVIHHKDGNKLNNELRNLECVSRAEHNVIHKRCVA